MKQRIKSILSLCIAILLIYSNTPFVMAKDTSNQPNESKDYVLAYYDIATGVETMLTAREAKIRFGLNVDPDTFEISADPKKATEDVVEKKLTTKETQALTEANKRGIKRFNSSDINGENELIPDSDKNQLQQSKSATQTANTDPETRTMVSDVSQHPYYSIAKIYAEDTWIGTGFAVGKNLLATARHCVQGRDGWASSVTAYFGFKNNKGTYTYKANNSIGYIYYPTETVTSTLEDWAFVVWGTDTTPSTGCFGMSGAGYTGMSVKTAGYPQDLDNGNIMYECSGTITSCTDYDFWSDLRVFNGQSGSPVYEENASGPYAIGIITNSWFPANGTNAALARRIDSGLIGWLFENGYI